jgi:hypothetical protein
VINVVLTLLNSDFIDLNNNNNLTHNNYLIWSIYCSYCISYKNSHRIK